MGIYESTKDAVKLFQKADNIELYEKILDIQAQGLAMQEEIRQLREENYELKKIQDLDSLVERHQKPFITFSNDKEKIRYCAICWGNNKKIIPLYMLDDKSSKKRHFCNLCQNRFFSE